MTLIETVNEMSELTDEYGDSNKKSHHRTNKTNRKSSLIDSYNYNNENEMNDLKSNKNKMDTSNAGAKYQGQKIKTLKSKIEKQMKDYVKQEEYEEMLKLIKKLNLISSDKWQELESEVEKLDYSEVEYKSSGGFLTDDEIAVLASDVHTPYSSKSVNEIIELSRKNSGLF